MIQYKKDAEGVCCWVSFYVLKMKIHIKILLDDGWGISKKEYYFEY